MKCKLYQVDAFTDKLFHGNPAAVCPLENWPDDEILQKIATENNLSETAFYMKKDGAYEIRWFTPAAEVDLCGHATLAAAFVLFYCEGHDDSAVDFHSPRSGKLAVRKGINGLTMDFPADELEKVSVDSAMTACFDKAPIEAYMGKTDCMLLFENESDVSCAKPRLEKIAQLNTRGVIITAKGREVDFVSRFFAPNVGVNEDPVTGSAHTTLAPYWAEKLGKTELSAVQLSARKGFLKCRLAGNRVEISGNAQLYLSGEIRTE